MDSSNTHWITHFEIHYMANLVRVMNCSRIQERLHLFVIQVQRLRIPTGIETDMDTRERELPQKRVHHRRDPLAMGHTCGTIRTITEPAALTGISVWLYTQNSNNWYDRT